MTMRMLTSLAMKHLHMLVYPLREKRFNGGSPGPCKRANAQAQPKNRMPTANSLWHFHLEQNSGRIYSD